MFNKPAPNVHAKVHQAVFQSRMCLMAEAEMSLDVKQPTPIYITGEQPRDWQKEHMDIRQEFEYTIMAKG